MKILRVESLVYGVQDLEAGIRFYDDWGLKQRERGATGAEYETLSGQTIVLRHAADPSLPPAIEAGSTVREVVWGVDGKASLDAIASELSRDREVKRDAEGGIHSHDESGIGIGFRVAGPDKVADHAAHGVRLNDPFAPPARAVPKRIGHVVFGIPGKGADEASSFYLDRLGFRLSDRTPDLGDFMRASGATDHHNLFLLRLTQSPVFNHVAFEVEDFDEIVVGGKAMEGKGWTPATRPGRHYLGSNLFWYFKNPSGGNSEYYADMDRMDDNWQPRIWEKGKYPGFAMWMLD